MQWTCSMEYEFNITRTENTAIAIYWENFLSDFQSLFRYAVVSITLSGHWLASTWIPQTLLETNLLQTVGDHHAHSRVVPTEFISRQQIGEDQDITGAIDLAIAWGTAYVCACCVWPNLHVIVCLIITQNLNVTKKCLHAYLTFCWISSLWKLLHTSCHYRLAHDYSIKDKIYWACKR